MYALWVVGRMAQGGLKDGVVGSGNGILGLFGGGSGNSMLGWMAAGIGGGNQGGASLIIMLGIIIWLVGCMVGSPALPTLTRRAIWYGLRSGVRTGLIMSIVMSGLAIPLFCWREGNWHGGLTYGLGIGFFMALLIGLMRGLLVGLRYEQQDEHYQQDKSFFTMVMDGLIFGASGGLSFMAVELALEVNHTSTWVYSFVAGLFFFLAYGFGGGTALFPIGEIMPAEIVRWDWSQMFANMRSNSRKSLLVALVTALTVSSIIGGVSSLFFLNPVYGLHYGAVFGAVSGLIVGAAGILTSMLKSGWVSEMLPEEKHITPNEGIVRSGRNALIGAMIFAPLGGIASGLACAVGFGIIGGLSTWPVMAGAFALMSAIVLFISLALAHGGIAWLQHYVLRWYLWRASAIPWDYTHFLDTAAEYGLLRKIGGGYMFIHRLVLEYFGGQQA